MGQAQDAGGAGEPGDGPHAPGEGVAGGGQLIGERGDGGVGPERAVLQRGDQLVGDVVPVREGGPGAAVGEDVPGEVRRGLVDPGGRVEQADRPDQALVPVGVRDEVGDLVEQHARRGLEAVEQRLDGRPQGSLGRALAHAGEAGIGRLGELMQVHALRRGQPQRVGEGAQHLRRRPPVPALLQPGEVLHAHPGERRHLRATQARGTPPRAGRQPDAKAT